MHYVGVQWLLLAAGLFGLFEPLGVLDARAVRALAAHATPIAVDRAISAAVAAPRLLLCFMFFPGHF
jgi:hypothetical protein